MSEQPTKKKMSELPGKSSREQQRKVKSEAIPKWAQGLYYNEGVFSQALLYHDDEALYFELKGKDSGIVRFSYEMLETLGEMVEEEQQEQQAFATVAKKVEDSPTRLSAEPLSRSSQNSPSTHSGA
jgi:hypothetical protein